MLESASSGRNARHHRHQQSPPIIPPSPTLSNPDMILPFDEGERESSTPSPPFNLPSLSHLQAFYENKPLPSLPGTDNSHGAPYGPPVRPQKKNFPRHTWLQDSRDACRRLSDIGEEEGGSPPHKGKTGNLSPALHGPVPRLASSPILYGRGEKETRDSKTWSRSSSSGSTISAASEPSLQEGTKNNTDGSGTSTSEEVQGVTSVAKEKGPDDEFSSAILESEAERILENAKKKLTLMEGNLSRARSSIRLSPSLSPSPSPSPGTQPMGLGQPVGGLYRSISKTDPRVSALRPRATYTLSQDSASNRHSRVHSETNLPSTAPAEPPTTGLNASRSMSAMGSSTSSNFHNDERSFQYDTTRAYLTHRASAASMQPPASVQRAHSVQQSGSSEPPKGLGITSPETESDNAYKYEKFNSDHPPRDPPSRAQSQLQVRDLQDQMKGLHIKISTLKVKAQEDNLRRRSLQSLRTPSPFTEGDHQWYPSALELKNSNGSLRSNPGRVRTPEAQENHHQERREHETVRKESAYERNHRTEHPEATLHRKPSAASHTVSLNESHYEDAEEGEYDMDGSSGSEIDRDALEEILREPLDDEDLEESLEAFPAVPQHTEMTPHEEREDAFDYEHFILHSALGNYSRSKLRRPSNVSTSSVETTRPFHEASGTRHSRSDSTTSLSTIATFATATEGDDDIESVLYWDRKFNAELQSRLPYTEPAPGHESDSGSMGTPRASRKQARPSETTNGSADASSRTISPIQRSESATSSIVSSLVSTVRAASSPHPNAQPGKTGLNNDDTRLLEQLFQSLGKVCLDLQTLTASAEPDPKRERVLRRRLDAARRVLDGELDA